MQPQKMADVQGFRADLLWFKDPKRPELSHLKDGLLVTQKQSDGVVRIIDMGPWAEVSLRHPSARVTRWPGCLAPGFIDTHVHYPQIDVMGSPASGLLPWLENYTFPLERRFADEDIAQECADFFIGQLLHHGVTTALCFATSHPNSVDAIMRTAQAQRMRFIAGKVLQDRHSPAGLQDADAEQSLQQTEALIQRWHGRDRLGYAITPRFAPTSSGQQLHGAGELAAQYPDTWIQSHVAENTEEVQWVQSLFPEARSYLDVYQRAGLLRHKAIYAHCIYLDERDRRLMAETLACAAACPTSNLFLGSGFFDPQAAQAAGMGWALASDVGGGTSLSPFQTMLGGFFVQQQSRCPPQDRLTPQAWWWHHTAGAAQVLGLQGMCGNLAPGCEADFVLLDDQATPLLARRCGQAQTLSEWLFALMVLGDDRAIAQTFVQAKPHKNFQPSI